MLQYRPKACQPQVCYFYLPQLNNKPAEVIAVLNSVSDTIQIPVPEEDIQLSAFFQRSLTPEEIDQFGNAPTWRIFTSWEQLKADLFKYNVSAGTAEQILKHRTTMVLQEQLAVA